MIPLPPELERVENDLKERRITGSEASNIVFRVKKTWCALELEIMENCKKTSIGDEMRDLWRR